MEQTTSRLGRAGIKAVISSGPTGEAVVAPVAHRTSVVVLGMHRSGTSAVAGTLGLLGGTLPHDIMEVFTGNPKGHFESTSITALDDRMLSALHTAWYDFRQVSSGALASDIAQQYRAELVAALKAQFGDASLFVVKDPRACRFFPIWRSALEEMGAPPSVVFCLRNPLEVANSLQKRDQFPVSHGLGLWLRHVLDGEFYTRSVPRVFNNYSDFLQDWRSAIGRIEQRLQITLPARQTDAENAVDEFVEADLRHEVVATSELEGRFGRGGWISPCYEAFTALLQDPYDPDAMQQLDGIRDAFQAPSGFFGAALTQYATELIARRRDLAEQAIQLSEAVTRRDTAEAEADRQRESCRQSLEAERRALNAEQAEAEQLHESLKQSLEAERQALQRELVETKGELEAATTDFSVQLNGLRAAEERALARARDLESERDLLHKQYAELREMSESTTKALEANHESVLADQQVILESVQQAEAERERFCRENANLAAQLKKQIDEILGLSTLLRQREREGIERQAQLDQLRKAAGKEIGRALTSLDDRSSWRLARTLRLRQRIAALERSGLFDTEWYLSRYRDVAEARVNPLRHYLEFGAAEGREPNASLDEAVRRSDLPE